MRSDMAAMFALRHLLSLPVLALLLSSCGAVVPSGAGERPPARVVEQRLSDAPAPRGAGLLRQASALSYAQEMARTGRFEHAQQPQGPARQGENLWTGTRGAYRYDEMMAHWRAEQRNFVNLPVPQSSRTGQFGDVAHYTQIVWARSTAMGCAMASNARDDFLVCRYSPTGNVFGERAF